MDYSQYYIQEFKKYIVLQTTSVNTIKNYLSDLRLFFAYITQHHHLPIAPNTLPQLIAPEFITQYENFLLQNTPTATAKRRVSSLKKFFDYCATQNIFPPPPVAPPEITTPLPTVAPPPYYPAPPPYQQSPPPQFIPHEVVPTPVQTPEKHEPSPWPSQPYSQPVSPYISTPTPPQSQPIPVSVTPPSYSNPHPIPSVEIQNPQPDQPSSTANLVHLLEDLDTDTPTQTTHFPTSTNPSRSSYSPPRPSFMIIALISLISLICGFCLSLVVSLYILK